MPLPLLRLTRFIVLVSLAAGCGHGVAKPPATAAHATIAPPSTGTPAPRLPTAIHWQRSAAEHRAIHLAVFREAREALPRLAAGRAKGSWGVSVDADETVIDNSLYAVERARDSDPAYALHTWSAWVRRRAATPVPGAIAFLRAVQEAGGLVAVVTNRGEDQCEDTRENFRLQAIPFDVMLCRPEGEGGEKEGRWRALQEGSAVPGLGPIQIVMWVGDNVGDFPDLDQSLRDADESAFSAFGDRYFVLPNPVYGSWEKNPER